jgi:tRNA acetyltransferase TAN1
LNLIITCARHLEHDAEEELENILEEMGDSEYTITITKMSGILTANTSLEPTEVIRKVKEKLLDEPWSIRYCLRIIPVQKVTDTNID